MTQIGFIGLGAMGSAIARRLMHTCTLRVFDLNDEAVSALSADGAIGLAAEDLARDCSVVITCLPRSEDVHELLFGASALAPHFRAGSVLVDMTTGDPSLDRTMSDALGLYGVTFVDAPVSGGPQAAAAGTLGIMVGAPQGSYEQLLPYLKAISPNVMRAGDVGSGHVLKLVNNLLSACNRVAAMEAVAIAVANGVDAGTCIAGINQSSGRSYMTEKTFPAFLLEDEIIDQQFRIGLMLKDVRLATDIAARLGLPSQMGSLVCELFEQGASTYGEHADINQLAKGYLRHAYPVYSAGSSPSTGPQDGAGPSSPSGLRSLVGPQ